MNGKQKAEGLGHGPFDWKSKVGDWCCVKCNYSIYEILGEIFITNVSEKICKEYIPKDIKYTNIPKAEIVEISIREDKSVIWINTEDGCVLRISNIGQLVIRKQLKTHRKEVSNG